MRLKVLLTAATVIASPAWAQRQQPARPDTPRTEQGTTEADERPAQDGGHGSTPSVDAPPASVARVRRVQPPPPI
jgi:hypothetical protein